MGGGCQEQGRGQRPIHTAVAPPRWTVLLALCRLPCPMSPCSPFGGPTPRYERLAYFDADMLALEEPDSVFQYEIPNSTWIAAHGSRSGGYFQTG